LPGIGVIVIVSLVHNPRKKENTMRTLVAITMVLALSVAVCGIAYAADAAAPAPAKPAAAAAPAAPAAPAVVPAHKAELPGIKAVVKGKLSSKMMKIRDKDREVFEIAVTEAKGADGKAMDDLKGKPLRVGSRDKAEEIKKFVGKDAEIAGTLVESPRGKVLRVESIK
jgi:hypothetical protein